MGDDRRGRDDYLERTLARLAEKFDRVPASVVDDARVAFFAPSRPARAFEDPDRVGGRRDS